MVQATSCRSRRACSSVKHRSWRLGSSNTKSPSHFGQNAWIRRIRHHWLKAGSLRNRPLDAEMLGSQDSKSIDCSRGIGWFRTSSLCINRGSKGTRWTPWCVLFSGCLHLTTNGRARYNASHKIVGDLRRCPSFLVSWVTVPAAGAAPSIMWISVSWMDRKWYSPKSSSSSTCKNAGWKCKVTWRAMKCHAVSKAVCTELGTKMNKVKWTVELCWTVTLSDPHKTSPLHPPALVVVVLGRPICAAPSHPSYKGWGKHCNRLLHDSWKLLSGDCNLDSLHMFVEGCTKKTLTRRHLLREDVETSAVQNKLALAKWAPVSRYVESIGQLVIHPTVSIQEIKRQDEQVI